MGHIRMTSVTELYLQRRVLLKENNLDVSGEVLGGLLTAEVIGKRQFGSKVTLLNTKASRYALPIAVLTANGKWKLIPEQSDNQKYSQNLISILGEQDLL